MATVTTVDFDHGSYTPTGSSVTLGESFTLSQPATLTAVRFRSGNSAVVQVRVYRQSDSALLASGSGSVAAVGFTSVSMPNVSLAAGTGYIVAVFNAPAVTLSSYTRPASHTHGIATLGSTYLLAQTDACPTQAGNANLELNVGLTFVTNQAPTAPGAFTAPTSGQFVNTTVTATWGAATDADGDALTYALDYSADNGGSWSRVYTGSSTSVTLDTTAYASTTAAVFRVSASDGTATGPTTTSPTFTVQHNVAPTAPTNLSPDGNTGFDRTAAQTFTYTFNDPNAGDSQSKRDIQYRVTGTSPWTTVTDSTTSTSRTWAANTFAAGSYEWQVRTYDSQGLASPWSASAFFTASTPPAGPSITSPANGSTIGTNTGVIAWSYSTQQAYQVRKLADSTGSPADPSVPANVYYDSGVVTSATARNAALSFPTNGRFEHLQVRVQDSGTGLWSPYSSVRVSVSYTAPATPTLALTINNGAASISLATTSPAPTGSQPAVTGYDYYRRLTATGGTGVRIAAGAGQSYTDPTPASGVDYEYAVVALGANSTSTQSQWTSQATNGPTVAPAVGYDGGY